MIKLFEELDESIKILLLALPFINWIIEIIIRSELFIKNKDNKKLILFFISLLFGLILGLIDCFYYAKNKNFIFNKNSLL